MALLIPQDEDIRKIHNEINQIVNQRYLITTAAVTVFGLFVSMLIPKDIPAPNQDLGGVLTSGTILLIITLLILFLYSSFLKGMLRTLTSYLMETNSSNWELDWSKYRKLGYFGYTKAQTIIFMVLGILAFIFPICLGIIYKQNIAHVPGMIVLVIIEVIYLILIILIGFSELCGFENKSQSKWRKI